MPSDQDEFTFVLRLLILGVELLAHLDLRVHRLQKPQRPLLAKPMRTCVADPYATGHFFRLNLRTHDLPWSESVARLPELWTLQT